MKTGLLICDHVPEKFRSIADSYENMFSALLPELKLIPYFVCDGKFPPSVDTCDAYICSGSRASVYDEVDWILQLKDFVNGIQTREKAYVGVCFGHQMLAEALGGKVEKAETGWTVGIHKFRIQQRENWMEPFQPRVNLLMLCQDQVKDLPPDSHVLAHAPDCPVGMFSVGPRMLGIQAHPEFPAAYAEAVIRDRIELIGMEKAQEALATLGQPRHGKTIAGWIRQFLKQRASRS